MTGATGMLGRSSAQLLIVRGDEVTVLQRRPSRLACREVLGDVADPEVVRRAVSGQDAVVHLAAKVDVNGRWPEYARTNIDGTRNVVEACRSHHVSRLVHTSSPSVAHAGRALIAAAAERADPKGARGHYSRSKAVAELAALTADCDNLAVLVVRPHLVWGPGDTQLVGPVVARARAGRLPVIGHGAALIDTTYVDNAAAAMVAALDACGPAHGEALVVSNGEPRPVAELVASICRSGGGIPPTRHVPRGVARTLGGAVELTWAALALLRVQAGEPPLTRFLAEQFSTAHWFDQRRTRALLGWQPLTTLDEGFEELARAAIIPRVGR